MRQTSIFGWYHKVILPLRHGVRFQKDLVGSVGALGIALVGILFVKVILERVVS
jgi:hypothetical protein